jgi:hypothetical protein
MGRMVVTTNVTLDGGMQAPGRAGEDVRSGFAHGGWALPCDDPVKAKAMGRGMARSGAMLFGRRTYEDFYRATVRARAADEGTSPEVSGPLRHPRSAWPSLTQGPPGHIERSSREVATFDHGQYM